MHIIKSWFLPALYLFSLCLNTSQANSISDHVFSQQSIINIAKTNTWRTLLHVKNDIPQITDPNFLLSSADFSPFKELQLTLSAFVNEPNQFYCRFPARYFFLSKHFNLPNIKIDDLKDNQKCSELLKYSIKVPHDEISLIYASEVLSSASSMMGHVFLKADGENHNNNHVSHSVSFFTHYDTFNPFKIIYDGLIGGMDGFFIVRPFIKDLKRYSEEEKRNVFEYKLKLNDYESELIMMHIWELKDIEITYLFQSYNCATLTLYILALSNPEILKFESKFVTPADVVKAVNEQKLIKKVNVTLSNNWEIKLLERELSKEMLNDLRGILVNLDQDFIFKNYTSEQRILGSNYLKALLQDKYIRSSLPSSNVETLQNFIKNIETSSVIKVDFTKYKNPIDSQQDSIFGLSFIKNEGQKYIDFSFLPASHYFRAKNEQFFSESELRMGEVVLRLDSESLNVKVQEVVLYSVSSLVPSSKLQPETSGNFYIGYQQDYDSELKQSGYFNFSGGIGKTYKVHQDIMLYGMLDLGLSFNLDKQSLFVKPRIGGVVNLVNNVKFKVESSSKFNNIVDTSIERLDAELSWASGLNHIISLNLQSTRLGKIHEKELRLVYNYHY